MGRGDCIATVIFEPYVKPGDLVSLDRVDPRYGRRTIMERTFGGLRGVVLKSEDILLTILISSGPQAGSTIRWPVEEVMLISNGGV